jgi:hypothetical protein
MTTFQHLADLDFATQAAAGSERQNWLGRIVGFVRKSRRAATKVPIYRITRAARDRWVVERPGASMEHAFPDLEQAVTFIRHECINTPATVELRIEDLYVVAQLDPSNPGSLFGEAES